MNLGEAMKMMRPLLKRATLPASIARPSLRVAKTTHSEDSRDDRSRALLRLSTWLLAGSLVAALGACGGSDGGMAPASSAPPPPTPTPTPPPTPQGQTVAALRLFESAAVHARLAASALEYAALDFVTWSNGACVFGTGSMQTLLDGAAVTANTVLPGGNHVFEANFTNCLVDGLAGLQLHGSASAAYTSTGANLNQVTALVSARSVRGEGAVAFRSDLQDVTAEGSGTWTRTRTSTGAATTYEPAFGSRLINNLTTHVATFGGGSLTDSYENPPPGWASSGRIEFNALSIAIDGTEYVLSGSLQSLYGFAAGVASHVGEVRIGSNGAVAARIYADLSGMLQVEVLSPLVLF